MDYTHATLPLDENNTAASSAGRAAPAARLEAAMRGLAPDLAPEVVLRFNALADCVSVTCPRWYQGVRPLEIWLDQNSETRQMELVWPIATGCPFIGDWLLNRVAQDLAARLGAVDVWDDTTGRNETAEPPHFHRRFARLSDWHRRALRYDHPGSLAVVIAGIFHRLRALGLVDREMRAAERYFDSRPKPPPPPVLTVNWSGGFAGRTHWLEIDGDVVRLAAPDDEAASVTTREEAFAAARVEIGRRYGDEAAAKVQFRYLWDGCL